MTNGAIKLSIFRPKESKPDIFDRVREKDIFDRVELPAEEKLKLDPEFQKMVAAEVAKQVAAQVAAIPKPQPVKEVVREVRVEVPAKDTRKLVEQSELDKALKKIAELEKSLEETDRAARHPIVLPGGSGVIGIPPPEGNETKVLTVENGKAKWKPPTGGSGSGLTGFTVSNGSELLTFDAQDVSLDQLAAVVSTIIDQLS